MLTDLPSMTVDFVPSSVAKCHKIQPLIVGTVNRHEQYASLETDSTNVVPPGHFLAHFSPQLQPEVSIHLKVV